VNATVADARGPQSIGVGTALAKVPNEPEYGEICFHEAEEEQLACMYASHAVAPEPWPAGMAVQDPSALFPYLHALTFDGTLEILANDTLNYLVFRNGTVARAFLASSHHGTVVDRVSKLFAREGRVGELRVCRWPAPVVLPIQAPPALLQAYRELTSTLVDRLVSGGRTSAPAIAEHARQNLLESHPVLDCFSFSGRPVKDPLCDTERLTAGVAALIRDVMWTAADHDAVSPEALLRELTWERRHMFQSAGLYDQIPWKVM
jgi:hypothetical protein